MATKHEVEAFTDPAVIASEMAEALDISDPADLDVDESYYTDFGEGFVWKVELGSQEYHVARDADVAEKIAVAVVTQDLDNEPEIFRQDFLAAHINEDRLRRDLRADEISAREDYLGELDPEDFWREAEPHGIAPDDEVTERVRRALASEDAEPTEEQIEKLAAKQIDEQLQEPVAYLKEMLGDEEGLKTAMKIGGLDVSAAAQDAVDTDGAGHFLSSYDGSTYETESGYVYWRTN